MIYDVPTSFFLPTFAVIANFTYQNEQKDWLSNNSSLFNWYYVTDDNNYYEAVKCVDLVNSFVELELGERESIIAEIVYPEIMLCPNITSF